MTGDQPPLDSPEKLLERLDIDFALQAAGIGIWEYDPVANQVRWDERCRALFGLAVNNRMSYEQAFEHVHRDDVARVDQAARWVMNPESDGIFDQTYRTIGVDDGKLRWVRFQGRVRFTPGREVERFAGVAQEVTQQMLDKQQLVDQQAQLHSIVQQTPAPTLVLRGDDYRIDQINQRMLAFMGREEEVIGQPLLAIMPELTGQFAWQQVQRVYQEGVDFDQPEVLVPHVRNGVPHDLYYDLSYRPLRESGRVTGMIQVALDVTDRVLARRQMEQNQRQLLALFEQSPVGVATIRADDALVIQWANPFYGELVARPPQVLMGKPLLEALPEFKGQGLDERLKNVITAGTPFTALEVGVDILRDGQLTPIYLNLTYQPQKGAQGDVETILVVATDVTQQVLSRQALKESEARLRAIITQAPVAMNISRGADHVIELANERMFSLWGREPQTVLHKPTFEAFPEAVGQGFEPILDQVYKTGEPYRADEIAATLSRNGALETVYLNLVYQPLREDGGIVGIMQVAIEVTEQVLARREKAELEARLQTIIKQLPSATVVFKGRNLIVESPSKNFIDIIDRGPDVTGKPLGELMPELESQSYLAILDKVYTSGQAFRAFGAPVDIRQGDGSITRDFFDLIYTPLLDSQGQTYAILSVATNVTEVMKAHQQLQESEERFRNLSVHLEEQVHQRTEELAAINEEMAATNEELASSNEEYAAINGELEEANLLLNHSNDNLERFAYVASHDLQEPLRKIQSFGDLLKDRFGDQLGEGVDYLTRMQTAASRMSTLIRDLLAYSRISTQRNMSESVSLQEVVTKILTDLELVMEETGADIQVGALPSLPGDPSQLGQLFQNLLSNALKFRRPDTAPVIQIRASLVAADHLPLQVTPSRRALIYHQIKVTDNGIGFDEKYLDRIFQVFQRLHSRNEITGTGIGLAICEKVATNHGGAITATSQPGQGATFSVYLPV